jgi:hypothetical protein
MRRPLAILLAVALAGGGVMAQTPIKVQPVEIGRPPADIAADRQQGEQATQPPAAPPRAAAPPTPLGTCNAGGCWDSQGQRYNSTGDGSRFIGPDGRMCQANGQFMHCH